jgi:hypothetical protein
VSEQTSDWWPSGWSGNAVIDCGASGRFRCTISVHGDLSPIHRRNYQEILRRWPELWPEIEGALSGMLDADNPLQKIRSPGASLIISVPEQPIADGVNWSVAVEFCHDKSVWDVPIEGWNSTSDGTQPHY